MNPFISRDRALPAAFGPWQAPGPRRGGNVPEALERRRALGALAAFALTGLSAGAARSAAPSAAVVEMWKSPSCGCCKDWAAHMEGAGFRVKTYDTGNTAARARLGMPAELGSCHTALVEGYVLEGHVPAREIRRLLKERPKAVGLAVPGMPIGSPGMDGPDYGGRKDPYAVLLVLQGGATRVFQSYR